MAQEEGKGSKIGCRVGSSHQIIIHSQEMLAIINCCSWGCGVVAEWLRRIGLWVGAGAGLSKRELAVGIPKAKSQQGEVVSMSTGLGK